MILKKLKAKIIKLVLVGFVCLNTSSSFALDEITEKKYKTFDGKIFNKKEDALLHEKIQKNVNLLMEIFKEDTEAALQQKEHDMDHDLRLYLWGHRPYRLDEYEEEYRSHFYKYFKILEEKGIEIEITLKKDYGTFTVNKK